jgi:hypothetical protein
MGAGSSASCDEAAACGDASGPEELRTLMIEDYAARPVPCQVTS